MPIVDYKPFATGNLANVMTQDDYVAAAFLALGFSAGIAPSAQLNKVWRQSSIMSAMIGNYIANQTGQDVLDDGDLAALLAKFITAVNISSGIKPARLVTVSTTLNIVAADYRVGLARTVAPTALNAQLPANAQNGQEFHIEDLASNFNTYPVKVLPPAGDSFAGAPDFTLNIDKQCAVFTKYPNNLWSVAS